MTDDQSVFAMLASRLGMMRLRQRLSIQVDHATKFYGGLGLARLHPENSEAFNHLVEMALKAGGLHARARANCLNYAVTRLEAFLPRLPESFDGFSILHLTDLHGDGIPDQGTRLVEIIESLDFDICLMTGDFRFLTWGDYHPALESTAPIARASRRRYPPLAILGNHDFIEMVPGLERLGLTVLLNESWSISRNGQSLWFMGVDDPHFYGTHDLEKAGLGIPAAACRVLLCHSPELFSRASEEDVDLFLCGHTHGGQICLPGGAPIMTNAACPRHMAAGPWRSGKMLGYTSRGSGASGCAARLFCPPELVLITLRTTRENSSLRINQP
jgi:hypothetical protein